MKWGITSVFALVALCLLAVGALAMSTPVQNLQKACIAGTTNCNVVSDITSGTCRTIKYNIAAGAIQAMVCDKGSSYEIYKQAAPSGVDFKLCVGGGCIDKWAGFARFTSTSLPSGMTGTTPTCTPTREVCDQKDNNCNGQVDENNVCTPAPTCTPSNEVCDGKDNNCNNQVDENNVCGTTTPPTCSAGAKPILDPNSAGFAGESRSANYDRLVSVWTSNPQIMQSMQCAQGTCLWVPWYSSSSACSVNELQKGGNCNIGTVDMQNNCMVTDEFSQVGMVLAMSNDQTRFDQWTNTIKALDSPKFGKLPVWRASRTSNSISTAITGNHDVASDADARVIIALYTAAQNDQFDSAKRASYKAFADELARDMLTYDFDKTCRPGNYGDKQICYWLASGGQTGTSGNIGSWDFTYGGYYGDVVLALLAAYKSTGDQTYAIAARETTENYLQAAGFDGSKFSVPPKAFQWVQQNGVWKASCTNNCGANSWDDSDAVRAVSMCQAVYYAGLNNVDLGSEIKTYCQAWMNSGGVQQSAYSIQYTFSGQPLGTRGGYYENGLGAYLNFYLKQEDLDNKLDEAFSHFDAGRKSFDYSACMGVYRPTFPIVSLGRAIGRDLKAFSGNACTTPTPPPPTCTPSTEVCDGKDNNCNGQTDENNVCAPVTPPPAPVTGIAGLNVVCNVSPGGAACTKTSDVTGGCRTVKFSSNGATEQVMICDKGSAYEMYLQSHTGQTTTCVGSSCVGPMTGFARWNK